MKNVSLRISHLWLISLFTSISLLQFSLGNAAQRNDNALDYARIDKTQGIVQYSQTRYGKPDRDGAQGKRLSIPANTLTVIKGTKNEARLGFFKNRENVNAYVARATKRDTKFYFKCRIDGSLNIGWLEPSNKKGSPGCDTVVLGIGEQKSSNKSLTKLAKVTNYPALRFCSAVADDKGSPKWGATVTNSQWDILSSNDPCKEAVHRCELGLQQGRSCSISNLGERDLTDSEKEFTTLLKCGNDVPLDGYKLGTQAVLDDWLKEKANGNLKSQSCSLSLLSSDELLVFPTKNQITVISAGDDIEPFKEPVIVVLAGEVKIVSPNPNIRPSIRTAKQACYPFEANSFSIGLKQLKPKLIAQAGGPAPEFPPSDGSSPQTCQTQAKNTYFNSAGQQQQQQQQRQQQRQQQQQQQTQQLASIPLSTDLTQVTRGQITPVIDNFLTGWTPDVAESMQPYEEAIERDFFKGDSILAPGQ